MSRKIDNLGKHMNRSPDHEGVFVGKSPVRPELEIYVYDGSGSTTSSIRGTTRPFANVQEFDDDGKELVYLFEYADPSADVWETLDRLHAEALARS